MARVAHQCFERFQKARIDFVSEVAEMATRPDLVDILRDEHVLHLLRPMLIDTVPSVQQTAALALGRLANFSVDLAEEVVAAEILPQLVASLGGTNVSAQRHTVSFWHHPRHTQRSNRAVPSCVSPQPTPCANAPASDIPCACTN